MPAPANTCSHTRTNANAYDTNTHDAQTHTNTRTMTHAGARDSRRCGPARPAPRGVNRPVAAAAASAAGHVNSPHPRPPAPHSLVRPSAAAGRGCRSLPLPRSRAPPVRHRGPGAGGGRRWGSNTRRRGSTARQGVGDSWGARANIVAENGVMPNVNKVWTTPPARFRAVSCRVRAGVPVPGPA